MSREFGNNLEVVTGWSQSCMYVFGYRLVNLP